MNQQESHRENQNSNTKTDYKKALVSVIILIAISLIVYFFVRGIDLIFREKPTQQPSVEPTINPSQIDEIRKQREAEWQRYLVSNKIDIYPNGLTTPKSLISACEDKKKNQEECNKEIEKIVEAIGTQPLITKAYIYIKAGVSRENKPLGVLTKDDSIWFYVSDNIEKVKSEHTFAGGHLLRNKAIINKTNEDGLTELFFEISQLPITVLPYDESNEPVKTDNALELLNEGGKHFIGGFVSTLGFGKIIEMKIGYIDGSIEKIK